MSEILAPVSRRTLSIGRKEGLHPLTTTAWTVMFACMPAPFVGHPFRDGAQPSVGQGAS